MDVNELKAAALKAAEAADLLLSAIKNFETSDVFEDVEDANMALLAAKEHLDRAMPRD